MTIEELRTIIADLKPKVSELQNASIDLTQFVGLIEKMITEQNPMNGTINIDQLVSIYTPIYLNKLTRIETAADNLGTDPLH